MLKTLEEAAVLLPAAFLTTLEQHEKSLRHCQATERPPSPRIGILQRESTGWKKNMPTTRTTTRPPTMPWKPPPACSVSQPPKKMPCEANEGLGETRPWPARHQSQATGRAGSRSTSSPSGKWSDERVIIFTEYRATQNWLQEVLAVEGFTGDDRLLTMYGGMDPKSEKRSRPHFKPHPT